MQFLHTNRVLIALPDLLTGELMQQHLLPNFTVRCFRDNPVHLGREFEEFAPDILIVGADWGNVSGVEIARQLNGQGAASRIIIFAQQYRAKYLVDTLNAGLPGFLHSGCRLEELSVCLHQVLNGNQYMASNVQSIARPTDQRLPYWEELERLSRREREVLQLIARHRTNSQIAETLFISPATVNNHRANIIDKLGLRGKHKLLAYAMSVESVLNTKHGISFQPI